MSLLKTLLITKIIVAATILSLVSRGRAHDPYTGLINPTTGISCCNDADCRPGTVWRDEKGDLRARIDGQTHLVPEASLVPDRLNPHPPTGMICEKTGHFYCVAMSGVGG